MESTQQTDQQRSADRRRRELLEAADRVVLRDGPGASMNAIAAEAGITKPILYRHFGDKGGLYAALAKRHTDALLDSLRAALDAPAERRERVEATLDTYLAAIEARPQVYRFLMHPGDGVSPGDPGFDVRKHSLPLLRLMGEELAQVIEDRVDLGPASQQLARVWGHGIVGMMHAAGDWWLGERPCSRAELVRSLADLLWGRLAAAGDRVGGAGRWGLVAQFPAPLKDGGSARPVPVRSGCLPHESLVAPARYAVRVRSALQVVRLVLEAAGEETHARHPHRFPRHREALNHGLVESLGACLQAREGQAALRAAQHEAGRLDQAGVDHVPYVTDVLVVGAVVDKNPQGAADLVRGEAHALGRVHRREHVLDERGEFGVEVCYFRAGGVENRVTEQCQRADAASRTRDGALSHGRKGTVTKVARAPWWCRDAGPVNGSR